VETKLEQRTADLIKWSFVFWVGAVGAIAALAGVLRLCRSNHSRQVIRGPLLRIRHLVMPGALDETEAIRLDPAGRARAAPAKP
jgi:hypothetical protein